ncbi:DNA polymerase III subunit tau [Aquimixticola soesokkakensis]|uniref:DNA polymerase III subunit tau n=1 Tax=Aquimixticola soesokkakensis TaxID=1519096 RepID=A0A1Y5S8H7_9RHOB|nr:DNA polymerase III subunit delta' [Aquimixticola soesokkakensis]SLN34857.1 DNA polymerase III subunit tau [Aquimixticola soesokkakensis]
MSDPDIPEADTVHGARHPRFAPRVIGHEAAEAAFLDAYNSGRMHHAWLVHGPKGVGKATLAWRIARFLLDQPGDAGGGLFGAPEVPHSLDVDPESGPARRANALTEQRLCLVRRAWDEKSGKLKSQITVDEVRKLNTFFQMSSADGGRRVVIVDAADEMNTSAANALLKQLEEPPAGATILLISHQPSRLLPTIRSRCRDLRLSPLDAPQMAQALANAQDDIDGGPDPDQDGHTQALAQLASGSVGEALRLMNMDGIAVYGELVSLFAALPDLDRTRALKLAESAAGRGNAERFDLIIRLMDMFLTRLARTGAGAPPVVEAARAEADVMRRLAPDAHAARVWATLQQELSARATHARAVNLDPAALILDMVLKVNETARPLAAG